VLFFYFIFDEGELDEKSNVNFLHIANSDAAQSDALDLLKLEQEMKGIKK